MKRWEAPPLTGAGLFLFLFSPLFLFLDVALSPLATKRNETKRNETRREIIQQFLHMWERLRTRLFAKDSAQISF